MALQTVSPSTWTDVLSTTMHNHHKTFTDNIFNSRPLLHYFMDKGRVKIVNGGVSIVEPVIYKTGDAASYGQWDAVAVTPVNTVTAAQYDWKQLYATIAISGLEEAQNNSKEAIVNLLEAKIMQAEETLKDLLSTQLYAASPGTDDFGSLQTYIDATADVGNIDTSTETWWQSIVTAVGATDAAGLEAAMRAAYNDASDGGSDRVDALFTESDVFEFYESTLTPQVRYTDVKKANLGFQNLMFKGVPIYWDPDAPTGVMFGLNSKYIGLAIHKDRNFKQSPFSDGLAGNSGGTGSAGGVGVASTHSIDARVAFITTYGNLTMRNRRRMFKLTGISEA